MSDNDDGLMSIRGLDLARAFQEPPDGFSDEEAATAWAAIDLLEKAAKTRKDALKASLLARAEKSGVDTGKGSFEATFDGMKVTKEKRQNKLPEKEVVEACLKEAGLEYEDAFSAEMVWTMDPSKVEFLVKGGKIDAEKVEASRRVTYALKMKPDSELKDLLAVAKKNLLGA
jgi:hypothetical protein